MKTWLKKLNDPSRDVFERRYRLHSALSIITLFVWLVIAAIVDFQFQRTVFFLVCDLLFIPTCIFTLRTGKIQLGAGASGIFLVFLMLPFAFFYNGGIHAGAPNWCILAMVFITLTVRGRLRIFLLISDIVVTIICYALSYYYPGLVVPYSTDSAYVDSLSSLIITGIMTTSMFLFQLHMAGQEREILKKQQEEIANLNMAQNRFFSSMSHEIRTPVNTIVGLNEMILRENISDEVAQDAAQVRAAGKLLLHLVNDILDMSKLESGKMELSEAEYKLGDMLSDIIGMVWLPAREKGLDLHVEVDPELPARLYGDEIRIKQILINILNNAIKYTSEGSVTLTVGRESEDSADKIITFTVSDTGIGIKKEFMPHLFSAFRRVDDTENRQIEGTGLGLAIVRQFVDLMHGSITVDSVYTRGSVFTIRLPQKSVGSENIGTDPFKSSRTDLTRHTYRHSFEAPGAKLLIVDDNAPNRMVVAKLLRDTRMHIDTAASGKEALKKTLNTHYHLIFMDHMMPEMDGIECLHHLRSQAGGLSKEARVVVLTANRESESRRLYAREGFDGYLVKPCSGKELEEECIRLLPEELLHLVDSDRSIAEDSMAWLKEQKQLHETVITTDSIADLPGYLIKKYHIGIIPHTVATEEGLFLDGVEIESAGLVSYMQKTGSSVKTIPPDTSAYESFFASQLLRAGNVIHISISSQIKDSGYQPATEAAGAFQNVQVVDSGHLSSGQGLLVLKACQLLEEGHGPARIIEQLELVKHHIHSGFIVEDLEYMARSGLVKKKTAGLTKALLIHPVLKLKEGRIRIGRLLMGSRSTYWKKYIASELKHKNSIDQRILFVTYVGMLPKELEAIRSEIKKYCDFEKIIFQKASPAISSYCGPGTFGLLYRDKKVL